MTIKLPALLGLDPTGAFTARNAPVLVLMYLAAFFLVRRRAGIGTIAAVAGPFVGIAVILNAYPFAEDGMTLPLAVVHSFVALWIVTGIAYVNGLWRSATARMDFVRFTGEWVVYLALIALGGGVLAALTIGVFGAIGLDAQPFVENWLIPCGVAGAVVIAAWLVEAKQSVIENIAPVLTKVFTPLFTLLLLVLIVAGILQGGIAAGSDVEMFGSSDLMVIFDIVLIVVLGLLLYSLSARERDAAPSWFDGLQLVMVLLALVIDVIVLVGDDQPDRRVRGEREQARLARAEPHPAREPGGCGLAALPVPAAPHPVFDARALADLVHPGVPGVGGSRRGGLPARVRLRVAPARRSAGR